MTNTYLLDVIKAFQPEEWQELRLFLASPFFNKGGNAQEISLLFEIILAAAPNFSKEELAKEKVYFQIFNVSGFVEGKFEKLMAELNGLLRTYALTQHYFSVESSNLQQILWSTWLRGRGLTERSKKVITKLKNQREKEKIESLDLYRLDLQIAEEEHELASIQNQVKGDLHIPEVMSKLDLYYFNYRTEVANRYLLQQKAAQLPDIQLLEGEIEQKLTESGLLQVSRNIFGILNSELPVAEDFLNLLRLLKEKEHLFPFQTLAQFHAFLRSSCTLLINNGYVDFVPVLHQIHVDNLRHGYFFLDGKMSANSYLNLVQVALRAREISWASNFIDDFKEMIVGGDQGQFFYRINKSFCLFAEGKFSDAFDVLPDAPSNLHYHHMVRMLELKIYYELNSDLLLYKIDSFRKFIERTAPKVISASLREMDVNFLNILFQLAQSPPKDKARSAKIIARIESKKLVADRQWLLEKARELG